MSRDKSWQDLIAVDALEPGDVTPATLGSRDLAVFDASDGLFVSMARCTHGAANLCDGHFDGRFIECPLHQGLFDVCDGSARAAPARVPLRMIPARVRDGMVQVLL
ncbi:non-heme iron oxygenase ferredoxin subunit [Puniceibacterium sp. IMCC21224]|uniref:non-heme iron oxygenase ferredoxin subunit n=1 Tax=Puniceibacterium sp. IMCC21224 TaxID=1618204 RepID=UPI00064DF5D2|nr:non-heme iron oxygenase ferredoxin subunit [Puniceibacterium sp. IMCC21224]KMK66838.1 ferredoxin subunit of nitrite reductase and ring-hydroxylating dioxygenase [Puniceibacterium sp. IMCC21224]